MPDHLPVTTPFGRPATIVGYDDATGMARVRLDHGPTIHVRWIDPPAAWVEHSRQRHARQEAWEEQKARRTTSVSTS